MAVSWKGPTPVHGSSATPLTVAPEVRVASGPSKLSSQVSGSVPVSVIVVATPAVAVVVTSCAVGGVFGGETAIDTVPPADDPAPSWTEKKKESGPAKSTGAV